MKLLITVDDSVTISEAYLSQFVDCVSDFFSCSKCSVEEIKRTEAPSFREVVKQRELLQKNWEFWVQIYFEYWYSVSKAYPTKMAEYLRLTYPLLFPGYSDSNFFIDNCFLTLREIGN